MGVGGCEVKKGGLCNYVGLNCGQTPCRSTCVLFVVVPLLYFLAHCRLGRWQTGEAEAGETLRGF